MRISSYGSLYLSLESLFSDLFVCVVAVKGMNFIAGMLHMYMPQENYAFGALVVLMYERGLRELYDVDMSLLQVIR